MERLCGRPGCSEPASVAYGMRPEDLVFWLDVLADEGRDDNGVLCVRHADSMVVPRGWTLDDLRDPELHLFRPPNPSMRVRPGRPTRTAPTAGASQQLRLGEDPVPASVTQPLVPDSPRDTNGADAVAIDGPEEEPGPWTPHFDEADDLDGLLSARSPLLSRAFRTADRASG